MLLSSLFLNMMSMAVEVKLTRGVHLFPIENGKKLDPLSLV